MSTTKSRLAAAHKRAARATKTVHASKVEVRLNGVKITSLKEIKFDNSVRAKPFKTLEGTIKIKRAEPSGEIEPASAARYPGQLTVGEFLTRRNGLATIAANFQTQLSAAIACGVPIEMWPTGKLADKLIRPLTLGDL